MRLYDHANPGATSRARILRRRATPAERRLWRALREKLPHAKWRRQVPVGPYVADFMCFAARLVIEADGGWHDAEIDAHRTAFIERAGFRVVRFWNGEVLSNIGGVLERVAEVLSAGPADGRASPSHAFGAGPSLSQKGEGIQSVLPPSSH